MYVLGEEAMVKEEKIVLANRYFDWSSSGDCSDGQLCSASHNVGSSCGCIQKSNSYFLRQKINFHKEVNLFLRKLFI